MDPTRGTTADLAERRLRWLEARGRVLATNIAQADTPGYRPRDIGGFAQTLARSGGAGFLVRTDAQHMAPRGGDLRARADRRTAEQAPNGNAVSLDQQALKVADTDTAHALASGLHRRTLAMFRTALGRTQ